MFEEKRKSLLYQLTSYFERDFRPALLITMLFAGIFGNAASWFIAVFAPASIARVVGLLIDIEGKFAKYLLAVPFFFAFIAAFSVCKFIFRRGDGDVVAEGELLSRYSGHLKREDFRRILFISLMIGALNTILLCLAVIWFR